ncbi:plasmid pRiA4b ORF-3 family protein [Algoriphagus sp.]|uniref:plasmid pRiA4b ORF-3 family protein n=1 Tax=Algoriphagus sp. TaxID=1872435 RepID=UPI00260F1B41|nr:plasmid pRiA4b ORF-3 family protein [Algoriphagus sp.]
MVLKVKIQIKGITKPPVWRRLMIPGQLTFQQFHQVIQAAFGWQDYHLFQFSKGGYGSNPQIGIADENWSEEELVDAKTTRVSQYLKVKGEKFCYIYDFGDDWIHQIIVEDVLNEAQIGPVLINGKGACPPEDCGGVWGYEELKSILENPKHPDHRDTKEWLGLKARDQWDVNWFDLEETKHAVAFAIW